MKKFIVGLLVYMVGLVALAGGLLPPDDASASHKVWLYCHKADSVFGYPHYHKASGVHTKYRCYSVGLWNYVYAPWPH